MGDYADMTLNGDACQHCGVVIGDGDGFPRSCGDCSRDNEAGHQEPKYTKYPCPECGKKIKAAGLSMHLKDMHGKT